jgi:hypothetical protein
MRMIIIKPDFDLIDLRMNHHDRISFLIPKPESERVSRVAASALDFFRSRHE